MGLKKIVRAIFPSHILPKANIGLRNMDFHQFLCSKTLIHSKKSKKVFMHWVWRKSLQPFLRYSLLVSCPVHPTPLSVFRFSAKPGNNIYLFIWYFVSNLVFLSLFVLEIWNSKYFHHNHTQWHTRTYAPTYFQKTLFWTLWTIENIKLKWKLDFENFDRIQYFHYLTVVG